MGLKSKYFLLYPTGSKMDRIKLIKEIPHLIMKNHLKGCLDGPFNSLIEIKLRLKTLGISLSKYPIEIAEEYKSIPDEVISQCDEVIEEYYFKNGFDNGIMNYAINYWGDDDNGIHYEVEYFLDSKSHFTHYITVEK
jgi:hypothetical protein